MCRFAKCLLTALVLVSFLAVSTAWATHVTIRVNAKSLSNPGTWTWANGTELGDKLDSTYATSPATVATHLLIGSVANDSTYYSSTITAVTVYIRAQRVSGTSGALTLSWGPSYSGTNYVGTGYTLTTAVTVQSRASWATCPWTGLAWTPTDIDDMEVAVQAANTGTRQARAIEVWVAVGYTPAATGLTVGTNSAAVNSDTQITASAAYTGDSDGDSSTQFERCSDSGCTTPTTVCASVTGATPRTCVMSGLTQNTSYWVRVTHTDPDGVTGTNPETVGSYTTTNIRVIPSAGSGSVQSDTQINLSAPYTGDSDGDSNTDVERCTDSGCSSSPTAICSNVTGATPRTCNATGLTPGTDYWFRINFDDADGVNTASVTNPHIIGPYTTTATQVMPAVATTLVQSDSEIDVSAGYSNDSNANSSTQVERCTDAGCSSPTVICASLTGASPRVCSDSGLNPGTQYWYRVDFTDANGVNTSNATDPQIITATTTAVEVWPDPVTSFVKSDFRIDLYSSFTKDSNADSDTVFERCNTTACAAFTTICSSSGASPRFCSDSGLSAGTQYKYRVTYSDADGVNTTNADNPQILGPYITTTNSARPAAATASVIGSDEIDVSSAFSNDADADSSTKVERCTDAGCTTPTTICASLTGATPRACNDTGLLSSTDYWYRIDYTDADGVDTSAASDPQIIGPYTTTSNNNTVKPAVATASVLSGTQIDVSSAFSDDVNANSSTKVERCTNAGCSSPTTICASLTGASPRACSDSGLSAGTSYWYRIDYTDADGVDTSAASDPQIIGPYATISNLVKPSAAGASVAGATAINVSAPFSADANGNSTTKVERCTDAGCASSPVTVCAGMTGGSPRACNDSGLTTGESYWYRIDYTDADGVDTSAASDPQIIGPYIPVAGGSGGGGGRSRSGGCSSGGSFNIWDLLGGIAGIAFLKRSTRKKTAGKK